MELFRLFGSILINNDEANKSLDGTDKKAGNVGKTFGSTLGTAVKWGAGIALAVGTASVAVGGLAVKLGDELQGSLNDIQSATGYSDEAMKGMEDTLVSIYNNNFGENFEDIGNAIKIIGQQTGATGEELKKLTENSLLLRDTFDFDVNESIRSANMLMQQFGMSGDDAYNLIAQGAQWGLNKNGDLLDTINEYSVHFKQMGFTAEEMFNMIANGAATGTFSVDKLGDAIKEFGIRSKDESKGTIEAFKTLGLDANKVSKEFAEGGEKGKQAFQLVTSKLSAMKDPLKQNQVGVALFGTMWEDLGAKGVKALTDTSGEISKSIDALKDINNVKYNTFGEAMTGIKRNLETSLLMPIAEKLLPALSNFSNWIIQNMPQIKETISNVFNAVSSVIVPVYDAIVNVTKAFLNWFNGSSESSTKFKALLSDVWQFIKDTFAIIQEIVALSWEAIKVIWDKYGDEIMAAVIAVWGFIKDRIEFLLNTIKGVIKIITAAIKGDWQGVWDGIKGLVVNAWENMKSTITGALDIIKSLISLKTKVVSDIMSKVWDGIKATAMNAWEGIKNFITNPIETAVNFVKAQLDKIKGFFENLNIKFPHIKLPHFSVKGSLDLMSLPPEVPSLAVDWYDKGGIFYGPQVIGVGEKRPEFVGALEDLRNIVREEIKENKGTEKVERGPLLAIETFINNTDKDLQELAEKLAIFIKQASYAEGGS